MTGLCATYDDIVLIGGARTGFADYGGTLMEVSPTDLGIAAAKAALARGAVPASEIGAVIAANCAQSSFDAYYLPRQIGLYAGVPREVPALQVGRLCASGFETLLQASDLIMLRRAHAALCVGAESMSRNPIAAHGLRGGFKMGQVEFKDFLWEATLDTTAAARMGDTAETLAKRYQVTRDEADDVAAASFARALRARDDGFHAGEIAPLARETFALDGYEPRGVKLPRGVDAFAADEHVRPTPREALARLRPAFGGVQTGGNSSAIVDGAAGAVVSAAEFARAHGLKPLAHIRAGATIGVPPEIMGIGPAPAIRRVLDAASLPLAAIDRFEINEAFAAQYIAVERELGLDRDKVNVNGGAIAIGHPLAATGLRCTLTLARELKRAGLRYGIASACAGGGQGIAILIENTP